MKYIFLFAGFALLGFIGFFIFEKVSVKPHKEPVAKVEPFSIETPPKESLKGTVTELSGDVEWQSRVATEPAKLRSKGSVAQGEEYWTKEDGLIEFDFPQMAIIGLSENSHINFVQTLSDHFVVGQDGGAAVYTMDSSAAPLSVRALSLLIQQNSGKMRVDITNTVDISVTSGSVIVAYNNIDNVSTLVKIEEGNTFSFDTEAKEGELSQTPE